MTRYPTTDEVLGMEHDEFIRHLERVLPVGPSARRDLEFLRHAVDVIERRIDDLEAAG